MKLKVGDRDKKHRMFLGWKVRVVYRNGSIQELEPDTTPNLPTGGWFCDASPWTDFAAATAAVDEENRRAARAGDGACAGLVPVYRPESRMRRVLRELVEASEECATRDSMPLSFWGAVDAAKKVLRGEK